MKKHVLTLAVLSGLVLLTPSCKKDDTDPVETVTPTTPAEVTNSFYAQVDAVEFVEQSLSSSNTNGYIGIVASTSVGPKTIGITIPTTATPGSYTATMYGDYRIQYVNGSGTNNIYGVDGGTIQVVSNDQTNKVITGTFSGTAIPIPASTATDNHIITDGNFTMNY